MRLSLIILTCSSVIKVTLFSFAQSIQPFNTVFKNGRGTFTKHISASSVNLIVPMKRLAKPTEVGELFAFLGSDESSYITGGQFVIDGGSTLPETMSMGTN